MLTTGRIESFKGDRGYGFIAPDEGGKNVFVHISELPNKLEPPVGARVEFEVTTGRDGRTCASDVRLIEGRD
jgi:cold shock protein